MIRSKEIYEETWMKASRASMHGWPIVSSEGQMICSLPNLPTGFPGKEELDVKISARGDMIAAAPHMLTVLEKALHILISFQGLWASDLHWQDRLPHLENGETVEFQIETMDIINQMNSIIDNARGLS